MRACQRRKLAESSMYEFPRGNEKITGPSIRLAEAIAQNWGKTIMAQCANFIVGKMNNENDKAMIKGMMPEGSESVIDETSMFSPGDVFVIGDAVPIPLKIHVALAEERPQSRTIAFWDRWKNAGTIDITDATTKYITG